MVATTCPVLTNMAISSALTIARVNLRMLWSGHLKTIWLFLSSGTAMNSRSSSATTILLDVNAVTAKGIDRGHQVHGQCLKIIPTVESEGR